MSAFEPAPTPPLRRRPRASESGRERRWRWGLLGLLGFLTALASVAAVISFSAMQLTERSQAETLLNRVVRSLLETDVYVANSWPRFSEAAVSGQPIPLRGWPLELALAPSALEQGQRVVADAITEVTARALYEQGFELLEDEANAVRFFSQASAFSSTIGRLTRGGHTVATVALAVSAALLASLALASAAQARGFVRLGAPGAAILLGGAVLLLASALASSMFDARAAGSADPFAAEIWRIASDASAVARRNAMITLSCGAALSLIAAAGWISLLRFGALNWR